MGKNIDRVKTRYNNKELSEFQKIIEEKLVEAKKQLDFYKNQKSEMANNPDTKVKGLDDGLSTVENERLSTMALRMQKHILHLENAKLRIQNRVYGICRVTGKLIAKERLVAVPHATLSMEAKEKRK
ncbi:MAG: RNA polymerase-binding transcription factor DksA [Granulosicoccus sp.]|jgi:RNA polymerase-binding transcription factor DksA